MMDTTLNQRLFALLQKPVKKSSAVLRITGEVVDAIGQAPPSYQKETLLTGLRELILRGYWTPVHIQALVRFSLVADSTTAADQCLTTLSVFSSSPNLLPFCRLFIEGVPLETATGRWIAFYAASVLLRAHRIDLLLESDLATLERALRLEDKTSKAHPKLLKTLELIKAERARLSESPALKKRKAPSVFPLKAKEIDPIFQPVGCVSSVIQENA